MKKILILSGIILVASLFLGAIAMATSGDDKGETYTKLDISIPEKTFLENVYTGPATLSMEDAQIYKILPVYQLPDIDAPIAIPMPDFIMVPDDYIDNICVYICNHKGKLETHMTSFKC